MAFLAKSGIGTMLSAAGSIYQGVSAYNASKANAAAIRQQTEDQVRAQEQRNRQKIGSQVALRAASGVVIDDGSPLLALEDSLRIQEQDIDATRRTGASKERAELFKGKSAFTGGLIGAGNTLLTRSYYNRRKRQATQIG